MSQGAGAHSSLALRWEQFWFAQIPPHIYALLRLVLGALLTVTVISQADATLWVPGQLVADYGAGVVKRFVLARDLDEVAGATIYAICLLSCIWMTVGFKSSIAVPFAWAAQVFQATWNPLPLSGSHLVVEAVLFCLIWADTGAVWSIDSWLARRSGRTLAKSATVAPLFLLRYQIALIYLSTGLWKLGSPYWREGSAVHYALNNNIFWRVPHLITPELAPLVVFATYLTLLWEISFAFLLLYRPTRRLVLVLGVAIHLGIYSLMEIGPFHLVMLATYLAFLDPDYVSAIFTRVSFFRRSNARSRTSSPAIT